ncbi:MAG TPA: hypothetical protein VN939_22800, partial [Chthoniobacterales bacterium]|nr:hypothetical protein [Chthoniobacterales bacterium]
LPHAIGAVGKTSRWVIPGSRLLLTDRATILQSGSPPGVRSAQRAAFATALFFLSDPSTALAFLSYSSSSSNPFERSGQKPRNS